VWVGGKKEKKKNKKKRRKSYQKKIHSVISQGKKKASTTRRAKEKKGKESVRNQRAMGKKGAMINEPILTENKPKTGLGCVYQSLGG